MHRNCHMHGRYDAAAPMQIALLRKYSAQFLLINIAFRSKEFAKKHGISPQEQILSLGNDTCITRHARSEEDVKYVRLASSKRVHQM